MNEYKIVFSDIDGTLLDSTQRIRHRTKQCISKLAKEKVPFILVSGRMPYSVANIQKQLGVSAPFISYSGALMCNEKGETIFDKPMSLKTAVAIRAEIKSLFPEVISYTFSGNSWITDKDDGTAALYLEKETVERRPLVGQPQDVLKPSDPVHKVLCTGEPKIMDALQERLRAEYPLCTIFKSLPRYLEIMSAGASKSAAAAFLCKQMNLLPSQVVAFGDNFNDADLLEFAGLGVAMGNAPEAVKKSAKLIALTNDEEGLSLILDDLFFKEETRA